MKQEYIDGNALALLRYPDTIIFTGGGNSYISITNARLGAECTLMATVNSMSVQIRRTAGNGRNIIFPLSDVLTALWQSARGNIDLTSTSVSDRELDLIIEITYDGRITKSMSFILINGSPDRDVMTGDQTLSDRRRGVYWGNSNEMFELFSIVDSRALDGVVSSWTSQDIISECYKSYTLLEVSTIGTGTPPNGNAEIILKGVVLTGENILKNSNFAEGEKYWLKFTSNVVGEVVEVVERDGKDWAHIVTTGVQYQGYSQPLRKVAKPNTTYTLSFTSRTSYAGQEIPITIYWIDADGNGLNERWDGNFRHPGNIEFQLTAKITTPANAVSFNFVIGNAGPGTRLTTTEMWITNIKLEEGDNNNPSWGDPDYSLYQKIPLYIDTCPLSERDMELNWFDELGVFCCWRFTEEYNETAVTTDATLTRMEVSNHSLYQSRTRMTRKQTTHTLHSRKVPRDVVPFIKSIISAPVVWQYSRGRKMDETMIVEDYKEKDYGRGYVDIVIKVTDTPQSYE